KGYLKIGSTHVNIPASLRRPSGLEVGAWVDAITQRLDDGTYILRRLKVLDPATDDLTLRRECVDEGVRMRGEVTLLEPGTLYSLNWLPMGAFVRMTGEENPSDPRSLAAQPKRWRVAVLAAGAVLNIIVAILLIVGAYASGSPEAWVVKITDVEPDSAAMEAGLRPDDIVLAVGEERIEEGLLHLRRIVRDVPEQTIELTILRGEETLTLAATPRLDSEGYGFLGIWMAPWPDRGGVRSYSLPEALNAGFEDTITAIVMTVQVPARLAQGDITPEEARPASIVGMSEVLTISLQQSIEWELAFPVLRIASLISLALGLTNLLPIPALDGGRILFVLIEALRGRRVPPEREALVHFVGLVIMISLMLFVMFQDVVNPIVPWSFLE
ncbi:MAG: M50 family metallopeptidase, partial [Chloroflexi bacterium]|nr:M50 family metallopeptidase [Chloroflexota bacterium]